MGLVLEDDGLPRQHPARLGNFDQEGIEGSGSEGGVCSQTTKSLLLNYQEVDSKQLLTREVLLLKARNFTNLLSNGAPLDKGLLVDLVDLDEDLGDLA